MARSPRLPTRSAWLDPESQAVRADLKRAKLSDSDIVCAFVALHDYDLDSMRRTIETHQAGKPAKDNGKSVVFSVRPEVLAAIEQMGENHSAVMRAVYESVRDALAARKASVVVQTCLVVPAGYARSVIAAGGWQRTQEALARSKLTPGHEQPRIQV